MTALTVVAKRGEDIVAVTLYERYVVTLRTLDDIYLVSGTVANDEQDAQGILIYTAEQWDQTGWRLAEGDPVVRELGDADIGFLRQVCAVGTMISPPPDVEAMLLGIW